MAHLILIRHGQSEWNKTGQWTGWTDIPLSDQGREEAKRAGQLLKGYHVDAAFTSLLSRANETLTIVLSEIGQTNTPITKDKALNERNYGDYTGKNKWDIQKEVGEEQFLAIRRGWDVPIPNGETLKDVYNRVVPYYQSTILPLLKDEKQVLIAAHGNSLRALIKYLEQVSDEGISQIELATGEVYIYDIDHQGTVIDKKVMATEQSHS